MMRWQRRLSELRDWANGGSYGGLAVRWSPPPNVETRNGMPYCWSCEVQREDMLDGHRVKETHGGYGVSMQDAIEECWSRWDAASEISVSRRTCPNCAGASLDWTIRCPDCDNTGYVLLEVGL